MHHEAGDLGDVQEVLVEADLEGLEVGLGGEVLGGKAERREVGELDRLGAFEFDRLHIAVDVLDLVERTLVHDLALVDHDDPAAEFLDVVEVVRRQDDRGMEGPVHVSDGVAHLLLGDDVEADRRFVEEEDLGVVEERGGDVGAHPLSERERADRRLDEGVDLEDVVEERHPLLEVGVGDVVDLLQDREAFVEREVPPELGALTEDDADVEGVPDPFLVGDDAVDDDRPGGRREDPGEHLDGRRLAGAVRADVADDLAFPDREGDAVDGLRDHFLRIEKGFDRTDQTRLAFVFDEILVKFPDFDHDVTFPFDALPISFYHQSRHFYDPCRF